MKFRKDKDILRLSRVGLVVVLLGGVMLTFQTHSKPTFFIGFGLIFAGLFMFAMAVYAATKPKTELMADKIWSLGIELEDMYWTTLLVGVYSFLILRWYYNRKGEIV